MDERATYYSVLEKYQRSSLDITDWIVLFLGCFTRSITQSEEILSNVFTRAKFSRRPEILSLPERQRKALLLALEPGFKGGLTTRKYMSITIVSRLPHPENPINFSTKEFRVAQFMDEARDMKQ